MLIVALHRCVSLIRVPFPFPVGSPRSALQRLEIPTAEVAVVAEVWLQQLLRELLWRDDLSHHDCYDHHSGDPELDRLRQHHRARQHSQHWTSDREHHWAQYHHHICGHVTIYDCYRGDSINIYRYNQQGRQLNATFMSVLVRCCSSVIIFNVKEVRVSPPALQSGTSTDKGIQKCIRNNQITHERITGTCVCTWNILLPNVWLKHIKTKALYCDRDN